MKLLFASLVSALTLLTAAHSPHDVEVSKSDRLDGTDDAGIRISSPPETKLSVNRNAEEIFEETPVPKDSQGKTHNNDGGHRISFADAIRLLGRRGKWVQTNLQSVRKAYSEAGVFGIAEYLSTLPDVLGGAQVIEFSDVRLVKDSNTAVVMASMNEPMPLNGPPFLFDLSSVLPHVLGGILDTKIVRNAQGERLRVVTAYNQNNVLLNVTSTRTQPTEAPPVEVPPTESSV